PTATGQEQAAGWSAARPTAEAKASAWQAAVLDPATPNATQRHIISGFNRVVNRDLLRPYVQAYFDSLELVWDQRSPEIASNVAEGLYPAIMLNDSQVDVLGRTSDFLTKLGQAKPPLRRLVVEGMDSVQRSLRAQACDAAS
ncbi:MAG: ERAP1-like C-terminal domain-containing protein, partial [Micrococcales bacterium]|nr:ERAP1-like C-terminal domain-containing protein [Micrococcales bacterium]